MSVTWTCYKRNTGGYEPEYAAKENEVLKGLSI